MIKAIETEYRGHRFRSRTEARWAVFFDALKIKWDYETEGFDLNGLYYLPDFWLPEIECYVEIKGQEPNEVECEKLRRLAAGKRTSAVMLIGQPGGERIDGYLSSSSDSVCGLGRWGTWAWKASSCGCVGFGPIEPDELWIHSQKCLRDMCHPSMGFKKGFDYPYDERLRDACKRARAERFGT